MEKALVEMYLAGMSVRKVEGMTEALWGSRVSPSTISDLNQKFFDRIEAWRNRGLEHEYPYVFVDSIWFKRAWGGEVESVSVLVTVGVNQEGYRKDLGVAEGNREYLESLRGFLRYLKDRGWSVSCCWFRIRAWDFWKPCTNIIPTPASSVAQSIFTGMDSESRLGARSGK